MVLSEQRSRSLKCQFASLACCCRQFLSYFHSSVLICCWIQLVNLREKVHLLWTHSSDMPPEQPTRATGMQWPRASCQADASEQGYWTRKCQYGSLVCCCSQFMSHFHTCVFNSCWSATVWNSCFWHACSATNNSDRNAMTKSLMTKWCYWAEVLNSKMPICVSSLLLQIIHVSFPLFRLQRVLKWVGQPLR